MIRLRRIEAENFRALATVDLSVQDLHVIFGPNGSGKSTFLDTIWFLRDCAIRGVDLASSERSHGIGALWDGAPEGENIKITIETDLARYSVSFGFSSGRIEPFVGELLVSKKFPDKILIDRIIGSDKASFFHSGFDQMVVATLREPEKLALTWFTASEDECEEAAEIDRLLHYIHFYHCRDFYLYSIKKKGSESSYQMWLWERGDNIWSVLRNLHDRRTVDIRFDTIIGYMRQAFPGFKDIILEQTGPNTVYAQFYENEMRKPINVSGVSDGHLQLLICLTSLFAEPKEKFSLLLYDEPEISLHPHALAVLASAIVEAKTDWNKQIILATHSPVLISQFPTECILTSQRRNSTAASIQPVSSIEGIGDLLHEYALGSLFMAEVIASQQS